TPARPPDRLPVQDGCATAPPRHPSHQWSTYRSFCPTGPSHHATDLSSVQDAERNTQTPRPCVPHLGHLSRSSHRVQPTHSYCPDPVVHPVCADEIPTHQSSPQSPLRCASPRQAIAPHRLNRHTEQIPGVLWCVGNPSSRSKSSPQHIHQEPYAAATWQ